MTQDARIEIVKGPVIIGVKPFMDPSFVPLRRARSRHHGGQFHPIQRPDSA